MLCPKNANGSSRWGWMESHSAATSSAMVFRRGVRIGTTATDRGRDSAQALYAAPPPPACGKQKSRSAPAATCPAPEILRSRNARSLRRSRERRSIGSPWLVVGGWCLVVVPPPLASTCSSSASNGLTLKLATSASAAWRDARERDRKSTRLNSSHLG